VLSIFPLLHCTHIWISWRSEWLGGLKGGICGKEGREETHEKGEKEKALGRGENRDKKGDKMREGKVEGLGK